MLSLSLQQVGSIPSRRGRCPSGWRQTRRAASCSKLPTRDDACGSDQPDQLDETKHAGDSKQFLRSHRVISISAGRQGQYFEYEGHLREEIQREPRLQVVLGDA
eukprot:4308543-Prymnesium_polylepis.1